LKRLDEPGNEATDKIKRPRRLGRTGGAGCVPRGDRKFDVGKTLSASRRWGQVHNLDGFDQCFGFLGPSRTGRRSAPRHAQHRCDVEPRGALTGYSPVGTNYLFNDEGMLKEAEPGRGRQLPQSGLQSSQHVKPRASHKFKTAPRRGKETTGSLQTAAWYGKIQTAKSQASDRPSDSHIPPPCLHV
jgi:hypothetical protein